MWHYTTVVNDVLIERNLVAIQVAQSKNCIKRSLATLCNILVHWTYHGLGHILGLFLQKAAAIDTKLGFALYVCT